MNYNYNFGQHENYVHGVLRKKRIIDFFDINEFENFIETGTYIGDTLYNVQDHFNKLYSIELSEIYVEKDLLIITKYVLLTEIVLLY